MNVEGVIFVGGSGRSGTTLICELLDIHPDVAALFEVWTLITLLHYLKEDRAPNTALDELNRDNLEFSLSPVSEYNWRICKEEATYAWSQKVKATLAGGEPLAVAIRQWADYLHRLQMTRDGSRRIVHKTPALAAYLPEIWRLWPTGHFLHMIRDPRDVIASYLVQDWGPTTIQEGVDWYCGRVGPAIEHGRGDPRYLEVTLESLAERPREILDDIQRWAGLAPETERMLTQMYVRPQAVNHRRDQLDQASSRWIFQEVAARIPALARLYRP